MLRDLRHAIKVADYLSDAEKEKRRVLLNDFEDKRILSDSNFIKSKTEGYAKIDALKEIATNSSPLSALDILILKNQARIYSSMRTLVYKSSLDKKYKDASRDSQDGDLPLLQFLKDFVDCIGYDIVFNDSELKGYAARMLVTNIIGIMNYYDAIDSMTNTAEMLKGISLLKWADHQHLAYQLPGLHSYVLCNKISGLYLKMFDSYQKEEDDHRKNEAIQDAIKWAIRAVESEKVNATVKWLLTIYISAIEFYQDRQDYSKAESYAKEGMQLLEENKKLFSDEAFLKIRSSFLIANVNRYRNSTQQADTKEEKLESLEKSIEHAILLYQAFKENKNNLDKAEYERRRIPEVVRVLDVRHRYMLNVIDHLNGDWDKFENCLNEQRKFINELPTDHIERTKAHLIADSHEIALCFMQFTQIKETNYFRDNLESKLAQLIANVSKRYKILTDQCEPLDDVVKKSYANARHLAGTMYADAAKKNISEEDEKALADLRHESDIMFTKAEENFEENHETRKVIQMRLNQAMMYNDKRRVVNLVKIWAEHLHQADPNNANQIEWQSQAASELNVAVNKLSELLDENEHEQNDLTCEQYSVKMSAIDLAYYVLKRAISNAERVAVIAKRSKSPTIDTSSSRDSVARASTASRRVRERHDDDNPESDSEAGAAVSASASTATEDKTHRRHRHRGRHHHSRGNGTLFDNTRKTEKRPRDEADVREEDEIKREDKLVRH